MSHLKVRIS